MKRVFTCAGGLLLSGCLFSAAYGGGAENKTNWSAEYIRTLNRNAATDYADIAAYNPAGTVKLQDGFIINGSAQYLSKEYKNNINGTSFESDEPSVVPGVFGVYNRDKWSVFGAVTVVGGGGKVDFSQGNWTTAQATFYLVNFHPPTALTPLDNVIEAVTDCPPTVYVNWSYVLTAAATEFAAPPCKLPPCVLNNVVI